MSPRYCVAARRRPQAVALALALVVASSAAEAGARIHGRVSGIPVPAAGGTFELHLVREDLELRYDEGPDGDALESSRIGVSFYEPLARGVHLGVQLGRVRMSQAGRAATADVDPAGYFIGFDLRADWPAGRRLRGSLGASWRYAVADASDSDGDETRLEWQTVELRPAVLVALSERAAVRVGASATAVDGDERRRGPLGSASADFREDGTAGAFAALELYPAPDDVVTLRFRTGQAAGVHVGFEHRY